jgi:hypothetical protein
VEELICDVNEFTALLLALVIDEPIALAPTAVNADPEATPTVAPVIPTTAS